MVNANVLQDNFKNGFKNFCTKTSVHGFLELYSARSIFWKCFWIVICTAACVVTFYQVYGSVSEYIYKPTTTVISASNDEDIFYPPLRLCHWQWYFWVDWEKALALTKNKNLILYALHYFNAIFTSNNLELNITNSNLKQFMKNHNFTVLFDYYKAIAKSVPIVNNGTNIASYFDRKTIVFSDPYYWLCYEISSENLYSYMQNKSNNRIISFSVLDQTYKDFKYILSEEEYNNYMIKWVQRTSSYKLFHDASPLNFSKFSPPMTLMLYANAAKGLEILSENDQYLVDARASVYSWLNKPDKLCNEQIRSVPLNNTCKNLCQATYTSLDCSCQMLDEAVAVGRDSPDTVCNKDINFLISTNDTTNNSVFVAEKKASQNCIGTLSYVDKRNECLSSCLPACQIWKYDKTVQVKSTSEELRKMGTKNSTKVFIEYHSGSDIIIMAEISAQSWQEFVGNVGGILGIWTGASIVSFIQLFYLCCFDEHASFAQCLGCSSCKMTKKSEVKITNSLKV